MVVGWVGWRCSCCRCRCLDVVVGVVLVVVVLSALATVLALLCGCVHAWVCYFWFRSVFRSYGRVVFFVRMFVRVPESASCVLTDVERQVRVQV